MGTQSLTLRTHTLFTLTSKKNRSFYLHPNTNLPVSALATQALLLLVSCPHFPHFCMMIHSDTSSISRFTLTAGQPSHSPLVTAFVIHNIGTSCELKIHYKIADLTHDWSQDVYHHWGSFDHPLYCVTHGNNCSPTILGYALLVSWFALWLYNWSKREREPGKQLRRAF